jgi:hypothetical protein
MRQTNFITTVRKQSDDKVSFIILANHKKNINKEYNRKEILEKQIDKIKEVFQKPEIIVITGADNHKVAKYKKDFRIVENVNYFDCGDFEQMRLGIQNCETKYIYIIPENLIDLNLTLNKYSKVFLSKVSLDNPGCTYSQYIENISYGIPNEINKAFFVTGNELDILQKYLSDNQKTKYKLTSFEVINDIIHKGGKFKAI